MIHHEDGSIACERDCELTVEGEPKPGTVQGVVRNGEASAEEWEVAVIDALRPFSAKNIITASCDSNGRFRIVDVPPGTYRVLAIAKRLREQVLDPFLWLDHKSEGVVLKVTSAKSPDIEVRPIRPGGD